MEDQKGSIRKTLNGTYRAKFKFQNKLYDKVFKLRKEAVLFEADIKSLGSNSKLLCQKKSKKTLGHFIDKVYLPYVLNNQSHNTYRTYSSYLNTWIKEYPIAMSSLSKLDLLDIQTHVRKMNRGDLSDNSANYLLVILDTVLKFAVKQKFLVATPMTEIQIFSKKEVSPDHVKSKSISSKELIDMLIQLKDDPYRNFIIVGALTGLRRAELCALTVADIDFKTENIKVNKKLERYYARPEFGEKPIKKAMALTQTKSKKSIRNVQMHPLIKPVLKELCKGKIKRSFIFQPIKKRKTGNMQNFWKIVVGRGKKLSVYEEFAIEPNNIYYTITLRFKRCGYPHLNIHGLRHTFGRIWYEKTGDLYTLQKLLGHESPKTTQQYSEISDSVLKKQMSKLDLNLEPEENILVGNFNKNK